MSSSDPSQEHWADMKLAIGAMVVSVICTAAGIRQLFVHDKLMAVALLIAAMLTSLVTFALGLKHLRRIL